MKCPGCEAYWGLFPPVPIDTPVLHVEGCITKTRYEPSKTHFRCRECKRVYKIEEVESK